MEITITPFGDLQVADVTDDDLAETAGTIAAAARLAAAFSQSSADGLLLLASHEYDQELSAAAAFWRGLRGNSSRPFVIWEKDRWRSGNPSRSLRPID